MNKKTCSKCRKNLSNWNLDFSREIICDSCINKLPSENKHSDPNSINEVDIYYINKLYDQILNREIINPDVINILEQITGHNFKGTKDFKELMTAFLKKNFYRGADLRRAWKDTGMSIEDLAWWLGTSIHGINQMLTNKKPLSDVAGDYIRIMGFKKMFPLKKGRKREE